MDVDFNNLRVQAMISYDNLCRKLNSCIEKDGMVNFHSDYIQKDMDDLRQLVGSIACVFRKDDKDFKVVRDEVDMAEFNPEQ